MDFALFEDGGKEGHYGPITFDVEYLDALASLDFPRLERVSIYGNGEVIVDRQVECYAQARLESFTLQGEFHGNLDNFLTTEAQQCPKMKDLNLECEGSLSVHIRSFLETNPRLEGFSLPQQQLEWSQKDFQSVCCMPELRQLHVPYIE
ncbi:hypothetical protein BU23DRAFT_551035 [Bimuria novae-zelandiae CBS 107.79]|uniref:Uncharacterized protein n=1 Tax=Bimuria novae-zelandiae CBS 107.79 TaxID=1447943 RepID=A0A6A5VKW5_9PLEO|nr:hypothetical protein BU23DRAFT_551035 [Bimuria novae-zelandiae CBS 107.79]